MKTLVVGAAMIDMIMVMDRLPQSGEDVLCKESSLKVGGCAYNVANTLNNLECEFDLCVPVGNGAYGSIIEKELKSKGYRTLIKDNTKDNGYCICMVESNGERTFVTCQGVEGNYKKEYLKNINDSEYENIYIAGYQVCNHSGEVVSEWLTSLQGKTVYFAPGPVICSIETKTMERIMDIHPIIHLNDKEILDYTEEKSIEKGLYKLYQKNHNLIIVTAGTQGAIYYDGKEIHTVPAKKAKVVDTIGAGDSHIGAFIGGISKGMNIEESLKLANKVAANIVEVQGPVMTKEEFDERMGRENE